jgi:hypothetical protein
VSNDGKVVSDYGAAFQISIYLLWVWLLSPVFGPKLADEVGGRNIVVGRSEEARRRKG